MFLKVKRLVCLIGSGVEASSIKSEGDVIIQGKVFGGITVETPTLKPKFIPVAFKRKTGIVHIQKGAHVEGDVRADIVIIDGTLVGDVHCKRVELGKQSKVSGDLHYNSMKMESGAEFDGKTHQSKKGDANVKTDNRPESET